MDEKTINNSVLSLLGQQSIFKRYHDILHRLTGGCIIDFISPSGECLRLSSKEYYSNFCQYIHSCQKGVDACVACNQGAERTAQLSRSKSIYQCHAGLIDLVYPLYVNDIFIGCLTSGQILSTPPTEQTFETTYEKISHLGLTKDKLKKYYFQTVVMNQQQIDALMDFLELLGEFIVDNINRLIFFERVNHSDKIAMIKRYVEKNYMKQLSIQDAANHIALSASRFSHVFKDEIGISFVDYLNQYRIEQASELLANTKLNISEIAFNTGFNNVIHFGRIFKKFKHTVPSAYRKSMD